MPQNKLTDLNNHLFAELERLGDEELTGDKLEEELGRAKGIAQISSQVISNANTILRAAKFADERTNLDLKAPELLLGDPSGGGYRINDRRPKNMDRRRVGLSERVRTRTHAA